MRGFHVEKICPTVKTGKNMSVNIDLYSKNCKSFFTTQYPPLFNEYELALPHTNCLWCKNVTETLHLFGCDLWHWQD